MEHTTAKKPTEAESLPRCGFVTFPTQELAYSYLMALDGYSGRAYKLDGGNWAVSFRKAA